MSQHVAIPLLAILLSVAGSVWAAGTPASTHAFGDNVRAAADTNNDGRVSAHEFRDYTIESGIYELWDVDDDGWIDEEELGKGLYQRHFGDDTTAQ